MTTYISEDIDYDTYKDISDLTPDLEGKYIISIIIKLISEDTHTSNYIENKLRTFIRNNNLSNYAQEIYIDYNVPSTIENSIILPTGTSNFLKPWVYHI